ncbi:hypothetical protein GGI12_000878 [Dipsacomyces acuminosporus]|nr:hypothetical protein GGI12_000878 [Dipsacomyces acuminosporus]
MSFDYLGPTRYDSSDSEDEALSESLALHPPKPAFVVRIKPAFKLAEGQATNTLVVNLLPANAAAAAAASSCFGSDFEQIGIIYAPAASQRQQFPIGKSIQTDGAIARIFKSTASEGSVVHVLANPDLPSQLQHGWVRALAEELRPQRVVLVDTLDSDIRSAGIASMNAYHTPAVLASVLILGLSAAILNYAETYSVPCRHLRVSGQQLSDCAVGIKDIDRLFDNDGQKGSQHSTSADSDMIRHDVSTSLYL